MGKKTLFERINAIFATPVDQLSLEEVRQVTEEAALLMTESHGKNTHAFVPNPENPGHCLHCAGPEHWSFAKYNSNGAVQKYVDWLSAMDHILHLQLEVIKERERRKSQLDYKF